MPTLSMEYGDARGGGCVTPRPTGRVAGRGDRVCRYFGAMPLPEASKAGSMGKCVSPAYIMS